MSDREKIEQTKQDFKDSLLILRNIVEAGSEKVNRFQFTPKEMSVLNFMTDLLSSHLKELS